MGQTTSCQCEKATRPGRTEWVGTKTIRRESTALGGGFEPALLEAAADAGPESAGSRRPSKEGGAWSRRPSKEARELDLQRRRRELEEAVDRDLRDAKRLQDEARRSEIEQRREEKQRLREEKHREEQAERDRRREEQERLELEQRREEEARQEQQRAHEQAVQLARQQREQEEARASPLVDALKEAQAKEDRVRQQREEALQRALSQAEHHKEASYVQRCEEKQVQRFLTVHGFPRGSDVNSAKQKLLRTTYPLHVAVMTGYERMVSLLLQLGARPDQEDSAGRTPLVLAQKHLADSAARPKVIRALEAPPRSVSPKPSRPAARPAPSSRSPQPGSRDRSPRSPPGDRSGGSSASRSSSAAAAKAIEAEHRRNTVSGDKPSFWSPRGWSAAKPSAAAQRRFQSVLAPKEELPPPGTHVHEVAIARRLLRAESNGSFRSSSSKSSSASQAAPRAASSRGRAGTKESLGSGSSHASSRGSKGHGQSQSQSLPVSPRFRSPESAGSGAPHEARPRRQSSPKGPRASRQGD